MNEYQVLLDRFNAEAEKCRREAVVLKAKAETYTDCAYKLEDAIKKSKREGAL